MTDAGSKTRDASDGAPHSSSHALVKYREAFNDMKTQRSRYEKCLLTLPEPAREPVSKAMDFAEECHEGKTRGNGSSPYIIHPIRMVSLAIECGVDDATMLCAAALHDVVENSSTSYQDIKDKFGPGVANLVQEMTNDPDVFASKEAYLDHFKTASAAAQALKVFDRIDNLVDILDISWTAAEKNKYLHDAETYVLPLAKNILPNDAGNAAHTILKRLIHNLKEKNAHGTYSLLLR